MGEEVPLDVEFELKKLQLQRNQVENGKLQNEIRLVEIEREKAKCLESIEAAAPALADLEGQIAALQKQSKTGPGGPGGS